jgi:hypothetical protein
LSRPASIEKPKPQTTKATTTLSHKNQKRNKMIDNPATWAMWLSKVRATMMMGTLLFVASYPIANKPFLSLLLAILLQEPPPERPPERPYEPTAFMKPSRASAQTSNTGRTGQDQQQITTAEQQQKDFFSRNIPNLSTAQITMMMDG